MGREATYTKARGSKGNTCKLDVNESRGKVWSGDKNLRVVIKNGQSGQNHLESIYVYRIYVWIRKGKYKKWDVRVCEI